MSGLNQQRNACAGRLWRSDGEALRARQAEACAARPAAADRNGFLDVPIRNEPNSLGFNFFHVFWVGRASEPSERFRVAFWANECSGMVFINFRKLHYRWNAFVVAPCAEVVRWLTIAHCFLKCEHYRSARRRCHFVSFFFNFPILHTGNFFLKCLLIAYQSGVLILYGRKKHVHLNDRLLKLCQLSISLSCIRSLSQFESCFCQAGCGGHQLKECFRHMSSEWNG